MSSRRLLPAETSLASPGICARFDDLIRPALRQAFPLPAEDQTGNEKFRLLLDALAQRAGEHSGEAEQK